MGLFYKQLRYWLINFFIKCTLWKYLHKGATAPKINIFTRALLPQKSLPKGMELVGGGPVIKGAYPSSLLVLTTPTPLWLAGYDSSLIDWGDSFLIVLLVWLLPDWLGMTILWLTGDDSFLIGLLVWLLSDWLGMTILWLTGDDSFLIGLLVWLLSDWLGMTPLWLAWYECSLRVVLIQWQVVLLTHRGVQYSRKLPQNYFCSVDHPYSSLVGLGWLLSDWLGMAPLWLAGYGSSLIGWVWLLSDWLGMTAQDCTSIWYREKNGKLEGIKKEWFIPTDGDFSIKTVNKNFSRFHILTLTIVVEISH